MIVWQLIIEDCESTYTQAICSTREIAIRELFKYRDNLIKDYEDRQRHPKNPSPNMYKKMIDNLSSNDYTKWDNYPHETPRIYQTKVIDK